MIKPIVAASLLFLLACGASNGAPAGHASGSATFDKHSATIKYGWLVRGPDEFDHSKSILRIYLSSSDVGAKILACDSFSCADQSLLDGGYVDFSGASYTNYWFTLSGGHVQFSGGTNATAFALTTNQPNHLAGTVRIVDSSFHGAKLVAEFDLTLLKTFKK
jgi:hypothetical protein